MRLRQVPWILSPLCFCAFMAGCKPAATPVGPAAKDAQPAEQATPAVAAPRFAVGAESEAPTANYTPPPETPEMAAWRKKMATLGPNEYAVGETWVGGLPEVETVEQMMAREAANPFKWDGVLRANKPEIPIPLAHQTVPADPASPLAAATMGLAPVEILHRRRPGGAPFLPGSLSTSFLAIQSSDSGSIPPDSMGDASPSQLICTVNGRFRSFGRLGGVGGLSIAPGNFFGAGVTGGAGTSDPRIRWDRTSQRWFIVMITTSTPNRIMIAVSNSSTITNANSFSKYFFQQDLVGTTPNVDTGALADYPTLGIDKDALYIGANMFGAGFLGSTVWVVNKASVLSGGPIVVTVFRQVMSSGTGIGPFTPQGVTNDDLSSTEGYFIGNSLATAGRLVMRRISDPGGTPAISGDINITVPVTGTASSVSILGSPGAPLDALDTRLYAASIHLKQDTGQRTLWTAHNFRVNTAGVPSSPLTRHASRWYEIGDMSTTPTLVQSGTVFDSAASNPDHFWLPSIAMNLQGHAVLGCSVAGANRRAEIAVTGRLATDAAGAMDTPTIAQTTTFDYNVQPGETQRWGDYSLTSVDPFDGTSFWTVQEYCNATNSWGVRFIRVLAPPPATPDSANPPSVLQGASNVDVTISGVSASGSGFFDPNPTYPNHISGAVSGTGVTVNSVTYVDPTTVTFNVSVSGGATLGARTVTVTNADGQSAVSPVGILTVAAPCAVPGDVNGSGTVDGDDLQGFVNCLLTGSNPGGDCNCAGLTLGDFLTLLL